MHRLGFILLILPLISVAEVVVPIDVVENSVNIRLSPDASSEIVGKLNKGTWLPLVESTDGWHEVEIAGEATGFISADWTSVVDEAPAGYLVMNTEAEEQVEDVEAIAAAEPEPQEAADEDSQASAEEPQAEVAAVEAADGETGLSVANEDAPHALAMPESVSAPETPEVPVEAAPAEEAIADTDVEDDVAEVAEVEADVEAVEPAEEMIAEVETAPAVDEANDEPEPVSSPADEIDAVADVDEAVADDVEDVSDVDEAGDTRRRFDPRRASRDRRVPRVRWVPRARQVRPGRRGRQVRQGPAEPARVAVSRGRSTTSSSSRHRRQAGRPSSMTMAITSASGRPSRSSASR